MLVSSLGLNRMRHSVLNLVVQSLPWFFFFFFLQVEVDWFGLVVILGPVNWLF